LKIRHDKKEALDSADVVVDNNLLIDKIDALLGK
jgi:hypothetical protein